MTVNLFGTYYFRLHQLFAPPPAMVYFFVILVSFRLTFETAIYVNFGFTRKQGIYVYWYIKS